MRRALSEAVRGRGAVEPNPLVGAVIVRDGAIIATGYHQRFGQAHAEVNALRSAGDLARGATLYVTLEPCCHHGKTPPCTDAIIDAGIAQVVVAVRDPFEQVAGKGIARLESVGIRVAVGVEEREARRILAPFLKRVIAGKAYVIAKWAMTLDGRIATRTGSSQWISGPHSRALVHETRGRVDGVLVGIGTALADDPLLTARPAGVRTATRIVLDTNGRLPVSSKLVQTARETPVLVVLGPDAPEQKRAELLDHGCDLLEWNEPGRISIDWLLTRLSARGMANILVEGGRAVLGSFFDQGGVDEVDVFVSPKIVGGEGALAPVGGLGVALMSQALSLTNLSVSTIDADLRIQGMLSHPWLANL